MLRPLFVLSALATATPAFALDCLFGPGNTLPADGATDVPTNVVVRIPFIGAGPGDFPPHLFVAASGEEVPATVAPSPLAAGLEMHVLTPDAPLEPGTSYTLAFDDDLGEDTFAPVTFTTGTGPDTEAPDAPVVLGSERDAGRDEWGSWRYNVLTLEVTEPVAYRVEVADNPDFVDSRFVELSAWETDPAVDLELSVGSGLCGGPIELATNDRHMRVQAIDMAGNVSAAASTPVRASGCSSTGVPAAGFVALMGLALLGVRRRR